MTDRRIRGIESARVLAASVVLVQHGMLLTLSHTTWSHRYVAWLGPASGIAVNEFFLISGYLLIPPLLATRPDSRRFLTRRIRRLTPLYYAVGGFMVVLYLATYHRVPIDGTLSHFTYASIYTGQSLVGPGWTLCVEFAFAFLLVPIALVVRGCVRTTPGRMAMLAAIGVVASIVANATVHLLLHGSGALKLAPISGLLPLMLGGAVGLVAVDKFSTVSWRLISSALLLLWPLSVHAGNSFAAALLESAGSAAALCLLIPTTWRISRLGRFSYGIYLWQLPLIQLAFFVLFGTFADTHVPTWSLVPSVAFTCALFAVTLPLSIATYRWIEQPFMRSGAGSARPSRQLTTAEGGT